MVNTASVVAVVFIVAGCSMWVIMLLLPSLVFLSSARNESFRFAVVGARLEFAMMLLLLLGG